MVMEAFHGFESRFQYDIVGHSGESHSISFVDKSNPPADPKQRLDILRVFNSFRFVIFVFFYYKSINYSSIF